MRVDISRETRGAAARFGVWGKIPAVILLLLVLGLGVPEEALGYTDPGTGALIWQSLIAVLAAAAFYFRRFLAFWRRKDRSED